MATRVVQLGAYLLVFWTYAGRLDLRDDVLDGLRWLVRLPFDLIGLAATPGGGES